MSPTAKILLGAGAVGGAGYLLWRLWPKEGLYIPPPPPKEEPAYNTPATAVYTPPAPVYVPALSTPTLTRQPACPPGTHLHNGVCIPFQVD